jgi:glycerate dehydrogenase
MNRITVLDGYTLNPGDLSWKDFEKLGDFTVFDRTPDSKILQRSINTDILLVNKIKLTAEIISRLPKLKYIGVLATGYNTIDIAAANKQNIVVTNVPSYAAQSVAQMVFAHILNLCNHVNEHNISVKKGKWSKSKDFCFWNYQLTELSGKTIGIVGLGNIGTAVASVALSFNMNVLAYNPHNKNTDLKNVKFTALKNVFKNSDIVSLNYPLTKENKGFVDSNLLGLMKRNAFLINTSRGGLINENALAAALNNGNIAGAGLDVLETEPPKSSPLFTAKNCYITPHIAWATLEARRRLMKAVWENLNAFLNGKRFNVVK